MITDFYSDVKKGKITENIFLEDFLLFLNIKYIDVTGCKQFQIIDSDYLSKIGLYEIKMYYDNEQIIIETHSNYPNEDGWFYKCKADLLVYVSKKRNMIFVPFTDNFRNHIKSILNKYKLCWNKKSYHKGCVWQSAFKSILLQDIKGYYSKYKKI